MEITGEDLLIKSLCSNSLQENEAGSSADSDSPCGPGLEASRHSWQTQEVAPGPASLLLARDSHLGRKHRADLSRRTGGSAFAWHLILWDPTGSNAGWICLSQKAPEQRWYEAARGSLPNHTIQEEKQDNARMDTSNCRELAAP